MKQDEDAYQVVWLIRRLFRALATKSDEILSDLGLTAADRAVMEFLYPGESLTVPEIATRYQVSRQHIQSTVNRLITAGYVVATDNPEHKRSSLMELTAEGKATFRKIRLRDAKAIARLFAKIPVRDRSVTRLTLSRLLEEID